MIVLTSQLQSERFHHALTTCPFSCGLTLLWFVTSYQEFLKFHVCVCVCGICMMYAHVCVGHMPEGDIALSLFALFHWDRVSQWTWSYAGGSATLAIWLSLPPSPQTPPQHWGSGHVCGQA